LKPGAERGDRQGVSSSLSLVRKRKGGRGRPRFTLIHEPSCPKPVSTSVAGETQPNPLSDKNKLNQAKVKVIDVPQVRKKIGKELGVPKLSKNVQQALLDSKHKKRRVCPRSLRLDTTDPG
jgi:hypothetical protein